MVNDRVDVASSSAQPFSFFTSMCKVRVMLAVPRMGLLRVATQWRRRGWRDGGGVVIGLAFWLGLWLLQTPLYTLPSVNANQKDVYYVTLTLVSTHI